MNFQKATASKKLIQLLNCSIVLIILLLPYWIFDNKLFIGGDDGRLFYAYPELWLKNTAWFSWLNFSSNGLHNPQQFIIPLVSLLATLKWIFPLHVVANFAFSLPLVLGFIFFQKMFHALVLSETNNNITSIAALLGGLFFVFSPILLTITVAPFLYAVWLVALLPILLFCFLSYLKSGQLLFVLYGTVSCVALSVGFIAIPWLLGVIIPIGVGLIVSAQVFRREEKIIFVKRAAIFALSLIVIQSFWLFSFVMSFLDKTGSFATSALSSTTQDTFTPTVVATMFHNNVIYPMLDLFHRSIVFNFEWPTKPAFEDVYDHTLFLNVLFIAIVVFAFLVRNRQANPIDKKTLYFLSISWLFALFLFTINIGPLRELFLIFRHIPGMGMFRNAYDKFAIGFVFIYALLISFSLLIILRNFSQRWEKYTYGLVGLFAVVVVINAIPIKTLVNRPLWTTKDIYTVINIPDEYSNYLDVVKLNVDASSNILTIPFAFPAYSIIKDETSNNVYAGASPIKPLTGINDFSGVMSFTPAAESDKFFQAVLNKNIADVNLFFRDHNIGYISVTNNIPDVVMKSYIFRRYPDQEIFNSQILTWLKSGVLGYQISTSAKGNYELYKTHVKTSELEYPNLNFRKISPVKYAISIHNVADHQPLIFKDSFNLGWKIYLDRHPNLANCRNTVDKLSTGIRVCDGENQLFDWDDVSYLWRNSMSFIHSSGAKGIDNEWIIDKQAFQDKGDTAYVQNPDGSIDVEMTLYFYPQLYFYIGILLSILGLLVLALLTYRQERTSVR